MNFENKTRSLVFILLTSSLLASAGCGLNDKLNDMHDKTDQMAQDLKDSKNTTNAMSGKMDTTNGITQGMSDKMDTTNANTGDVLNVTRDTYHGMRPLLGDADHIASFSAMIKDATLGEKLSDAAGYYYTFEYQGYKGVQGDTPATQEYLKTLAALDFVEKAGGLLINSPLDTPMDNNILDRLALAGTMAFVYPQQKIDGATNKFPVISMYELVVQAMQNLKQHPQETSEELNAEHPFLITFREKIDTLVGMMQARLNFLAIFVYGEISGLEYEYKPLGFFKTLDLEKPWIKTELNHIPWVHVNGTVQEINLYMKNLTEIEQFNYYLKGALRTKRALIDYGADATLSNSISYLSISDLYKKVNFNPTTPLATDSAHAYLRPAITEFNTLVDELKMPWQAFMSVDQKTYKDDRPNTL